MMSRPVDAVAHSARRAEILGAAAACFAERGFAGTTVRDICSRAQISSGRLFHYFDSKTAIFTAMFLDDRAEFARKLAAVDPAEPWVGLLGLVDEMVAEGEDDDSAGMAIAVMELARRDPTFAAVLAHNDAQARHGMQQLLDAAAALGQIAPPLPTGQAAAWILALTDVSYLHAADPALGPSPRTVMRLLLERFLDPSHHGRRTDGPASLSQRPPPP
jgi:AcrR family transcriptional regulator